MEITVPSVRFSTEELIGEGRCFLVTDPYLQFFIHSKQIEMKVAIQIRKECDA